MYRPQCGSCCPFVAYRDTKLAPTHYPMRSKKSQAAGVDHGFNSIRMICSDGCLIKNNCGPLLRLHLSDPFHRIIVQKLDDERKWT